MTANSMSSAMAEALSPAARLFHTPKLNCYIISILGCKTKINSDVIVEGLKHTLIKHPRFSSKLVKDDEKSGKPRWIRTNVNVKDHVVIPDIDPEIQNSDQFIDDYVSNLTTIPLDISKPLWEIHILNVKSSEAESIGVLKIHHSVGDGMSIMSLVLACTRKTSDPQALPSIPVLKRPKVSDGYSDRNKFLRLVLFVWSVMRLVLNTFVDLVVFLATILFLEDTKNPLKAGHSVDEHSPKKFVHRMISLDDIKLVKNAMKMTINDVLIGVTQAGLSQYLDRKLYEKQGKIERGGGTRHSSNNLPKRIRLRAAILVNLRPTTGIQSLADMMAKESHCRWGNWIGYVLFPFSIGLRNDPLDYLRQAKATIDRKKHSLEAVFTFSSCKYILQIFGAKAAAAVVNRVLSNTTMSFSNMVGPLEEISFYGHPMTYVAPSVYGHGHALTIHFQSYINKMTISIAVDPTVIPDPHQLCDDLEEALKSIKVAVLERGLLKNVS